MNIRLSIRTAAIAAAILCAAILPVGGHARAELRYLNQGTLWNLARDKFYSQDQGSRIMPLDWMQALQLPSGKGFLADGLQRYGYLPNPASASHLPVGFTTGMWQVGNRPNRVFVGMTCSACHTRQITVGAVSYRIDGGPAIVDFHGFLTDLDAAAGKVLSDDQSFAAFAARLPKASNTPDLKQRLAEWYGPYHALVRQALPSDLWGPGRLDAISMIFNRLTGLDIGTGADRVITANITAANAPTRYPFIWNAPRQDKTQWPGFADNGTDVLGLARNLGEVYGVFGAFHPKAGAGDFGYDFRNGNSANFPGLLALETMVRLIGPPRWPFGFAPNHRDLADKGKAVFERDWHDGGCAQCHGKVEYPSIEFPKVVWKTPACDVKTDSRQYDTLKRLADPGVLTGAQIPFLTKRLGDGDTTAFDVLKTAVVGAILEQAGPFPIGDTHFLDKGSQLAGAFNPPSAPKPPCILGGTQEFAYEARVLEGIWAAAPYLHNGSVPTLTDLLEPPEKRPASFAMGPAYDIEKVGIAGTQTTFGQELKTGCADRHSGNSNCGHDFGTWLKPDEKVQLLEYLKEL